VIVRGISMTEMIGVEIELKTQLVPSPDTDARPNAGEAIITALYV
jgi:hypothetical protein